jgi:hypothetical protein
MLTQKMMVGMSILIFVGISIPAWAVDVTWYVSWDDGNDARDCNCWAEACKTIGRALERCTDANNDTIDVNSGDYDTKPIIIDSNNVRFSFQADVNVSAYSIFNPNDPCNPDDDVNSFRSPWACLFTAKSKSNIVFDGNDTLFRMRMNEGEYPELAIFNASTAVDLDANTISIPEHGYRVGDKVRYWCSSSCTRISPLQGPDTPPNYGFYYVIPKGQDTIALADSFDDAKNGNDIDLDAKPSSTEYHQLQSQWRHIIKLLSCTNVDINDLELKWSGGDGIVVGTDYYNANQKYCKDVEIRYVVCDENYRNGITVSSVDGCLIEECVLKNTGGTPPQAGIDIECHKDYEKMTNVVMRNTQIQDNRALGISVFLAPLDSSSTVDITIEDCDVNGIASEQTATKDRGIYIAYLLDDGPDGSITFRNVTVEDAFTGVWFHGKSKQAATVEFHECVWQDIGTQTGSYAIDICDVDYSHIPVATPGGVDFNDCQVFDNHTRAAIRYDNKGHTLYDIQGDIYVQNCVRDTNLADWNGANSTNVDVNVVHFNAFNKTSTEPYSSIQAAIDAATTGDVIEVAPCTHYETVDFNGMAITVRSFDPTDWEDVNSTVIDANGANYGVYFHNSETSSSKLKGFTITGADMHGIYCYNASPTISDCNVTANGSSTADGAGMFNDYYSSPTVTNCIFANNTADWGGAMYNDDHSSPTVTSCVFSKNTANDGAGMLNYDNSAPQVINCAFYDNDADYDGGGMYNENDAEPDVINCTFFDNYADDYGGALYNYDDPIVTIINCILWDNTAGSSGGEIYNDNAEVYVSYSDIEGELNGTKCGGDSSDDEGDNIDDDPDFEDDTDPDGADDIWGTCDDGLRLDSTSPCADEGHDSSVPQGVDEDIKGSDRIINGDVDMGAYEYDSGC